MKLNTSTITVDFSWTDKTDEAAKWLKELELYPCFAADFETAVRYSPEEIDFIRQISEDPKQQYIEKKRAEALLAATALDHPAHVMPTHLSVAVSDSSSKVIVINSQEMFDLVLDFLVSTDTKQIWHKASYDFKLIYYYSGKMPKDYEDTQVFAKTILNHVEVSKATVGLKELAGAAYGNWGISDDNFTKEQMYDPLMLKYAATDSCATMWVYNKLMDATAAEMDYIRSTVEDYSPMDQLPMESPKGAKYPEAYFYHNTAKFLVRDTVRLMINGLPISLDKVKELENSLDEILENVDQKIQNNVLVRQFLGNKHDELTEAFVSIQKKKLKSPEDYLAEFKPGDKVHRSYFMEIFASRTGITKPKELLPTGIPLWKAAAVKKLATAYPPLLKIVNKTISPDNPTVKAAMELLAKHKAEMYNEKYLKAIRCPNVKVPTFNPNSSVMKQEIFEWLGLESDTVSAKTGNSSWNREEIERVNKTSQDEDIIEFTQALIDFSYAAIVKNNFVNSFYRYTVGDELHGQYNLLGAKSGRFTSSNPNMLNSPSSGSIFAKPVKKCFTAPKGFVVAAIDYAALEDRVIANLSEDENKLNVFLKGVDGHSLAAMFYWPQAASEVVPEEGDATTRALLFKERVDEKNSTAVELRSRGKRISFGLAYGAFPPKVSKSAKIPLAEAEEIFQSYHNKLYPKVTEYRENYVLQSAKEDGYVHLGMGFRLYTDSPDRDIRTLNNATCQFWSILTILTINKLHQLIDKNGYSDKIFITSTIYDSIYFVVEDNPKTIKWLNDVIVPLMEKDFMEKQILQNSVDLEIGPNWAELYKLSHSATEQEIKEVIKNDFSTRR